MRCIYKSCVKDLKIKKSRIVGFKGVLMKTKKLTKIAGVITLLACIWGDCLKTQNPSVKFDGKDKKRH